MSNPGAVVLSNSKNAPVMSFQARRSPVISIHGSVACSQSLVSNMGLDILKSGGNAMDAAITIAAGLNLMEPCSTGLGGDCFCLFYDAKTKTVSGLNGSGRAPQGLSIDGVPLSDRIKINELDGNGDGSGLAMNSIHTVTVPGSAKGWEDSLTRWGTKTLKTVLAPVIQAAREGVPIHPVTSSAWENGLPLLLTGPHSNELLINGKPPKAGEIFKNPYLANSLELLANEGAKGFYGGWVGDSIISILKERGSFMTKEDLINHTSTFVTPIKTHYKGIDVWEIPPNGQGLTVLLALNILTALKELSIFDLDSASINSVEYFHCLIEVMRIAFADTRWFICDLDHNNQENFHKLPLVEKLLSKEYAQERAKLFNISKRNNQIKRGSPLPHSDTVSFVVVDSQGNACSFINSNYAGFGTGLIPKGCGFTLQNRGANFSLDPSHPNSLKGGKRPYHTIIPGLATKEGELFAPFSVMGGFMQPQGHVQLLNYILRNIDPQLSIDLPRFCISSGSAVSDGLVLIEENLPAEVIESLKSKGHPIKVLSGDERMQVGKAQIILKKNGALWAASDGRSDGAAIGY